MYKLVKDDISGIVQSVFYTVNNSIIPFDPANRDYTEYLEWLSKGNVPLPPDEPTLPE